MTEGRKDEAMAKLMSKSEIVQKIAEQLSNNLTRDEIKGVLDALTNICRCGTYERLRGAVHRAAALMRA